MEKIFNKLLWRLISFTDIHNFWIVLPKLIRQGLASYAQARIWLDEQVRFNLDHSQVAIYNMPFLYRLSSTHTLSVKQFHQALQLTITKHQALRTSLIFDSNKNQLLQRVNDLNDSHKPLFTFTESTFQTNEQLDEIMYDEKRNSQYFDLTQGLVFRCHLIYYKQISSNDLLCDKDVIIFNFHHALFDFPSMDIFLRDLNQAYTTNQLSTDDNMNLRYLDYAVIEQEMSMTGASLFWQDVLYDCNFDRSLPLPFDRHRLANEYNTGRGTSVSFDFGEDLSQAFLLYTLSNHIEPIHIALACYYTFLFKLTNGQRDLCIGTNTDGRYREELMSVIGMFVNAIPLRCQLDPHWSFHQLVERVVEIETNSIKYSYFPLQRILALHPNTSKAAFLEISFVFHAIENESINNEIMIGESQLDSLSTTQTVKYPQKLAVELDEQSLTYSELLYCNIICQCVERSLSMVIGMMAIETVGCAYCPLSPQDPLHRLYSLIRQTRNSVLLTHYLTKTKFNSDIVLFDIDTVLIDNGMENDDKIYPLLDVLVVPDNVAYVIFTSGSTGTPKAVSPASFAQERIFLDEQVRFSNEVAIYNELSIQRLVQGSLSIDRLLKALRYIISKHNILRSSLIFDNEDSTLKQYVTQNHLSFSLVNEQTFENESELFDIIHKVTSNPTLFNLSEGRVFHCEIIRQQNLTNENNDKELIRESDVVILAFHHAASDRSSFAVFFEDLSFAYNNNNDTTWFEDEDSIQYIDYSVHERLMDMTLSREFWHFQLDGYNPERPLALPVDRHRSSADQRSGLSSTTYISFSKEISKSFLDYASSHQVTPFQLGLATFYIFLFKLTHGQTDLCVTSVNANRYRSELQSLIGMFVSTLPYRFQLDGNWSFDEID
ncbi:hypothetical protein I4U23_005470 [Adineta vaga]|nr:hypothetical protein I4U23_005470 [Adineta vaga]